MKTEILAPVGGQEQLLAAVRCGADAVYLGAKGFNARRNAENFEESSLAGTVSYCHSRGVRVHVTVNTLVMDREYPELERTADEIAAAGADAVIVQDLAVMRLFLSRYPTLDVHASTQCAVHNTDGVRFFEDLGVKRVVLARELSIKEIEKIRARTGVELEAFVHGALCMCLSGACYLSSMIGGRSGNRGMCAQPCRLDFRNGKNGYALSLKDMSHLSHIRELRDAGVCSFKIEGRMKRPEYVAAAVTAAKKALAGEDYDEETLRAVFSRSGFTDGYAVGKRTPDMFGHRGKEDVVAADRVMKDLSRLYEKESATVPVMMELDIGTKKSELRASAVGKTVVAEGEPGIRAESRPTDEVLASKSLGRLGGTQFYLDGLEVTNDAGLMLPPSSLNALRREAAEKLNAELGSTAPHGRADFEFDALPPHRPEASELWGRFQRSEQVIPGFDRIIVPIEELEKHPELISEKTVGELPAVSFPDREEVVEERLRRLMPLGLGAIWTENAYGIELARRLGLRAYGGAGLNILSSRSLEEYKKIGLSAATVSFELAMKKIGSLARELPRGYIVYGRLPLMRFRACPMRGGKGCGSCDGHRSLTDRLGNEFRVECHERQFQTLLNCVPLHLGGREQARADFRLMYFTAESRAEVERAKNEIEKDRPPEGERTGGLYYRTLL